VAGFGIDRLEGLDQRADAAPVLDFVGIEADVDEVFVHRVPVVFFRVLLGKRKQGRRPSRHTCGRSQKSAVRS
jgi:hypothetical protein